MSASITSQMVLGFLVTQEDFIETKSRPVQCEKGHAQKGKDPFCSKDGTAFEVRPREVPTKALKALYEDAKIRWDPEDSAEEAYRDLWEDGNGPIFHLPTDYRNGIMVVGMRIEKTSNYQVWLLNVSPERLQMVRDRVTVMREALGMSDRPILLYSSLDIR